MQADEFVSVYASRIGIDELIRWCEIEYAAAQTVVLHTQEHKLPLLVRVITVQEENTWKYRLETARRLQKSCVLHGEETCVFNEQTESVAFGTITTDG